MPDRTVQAVNNPYYSNLVSSVTVTVTDEIANGRVATIRFKGPNGAIRSQAALFAYLSDDAGGLGIAATAPSGGVAIDEEGGWIPLVAGKAGYIVSNAEGEVDLSIGEATDKTFYLVIVLPDGSLNITTVDFA